MTRNINTPDRSTKSAKREAGIDVASLIDKAGRIAVLYGGQSSERSVSLESGAACLKALSEKGFDVHGIDIGDNPLQQILNAKPDFAFIALHGPGGEDGKIQALLEFLQIPYSGSGVAASALCMDKLRTKQLWCGVGLPTPEFTLVQNIQECRDALRLGDEVIVKPSREGSSYGVARVSSEAALVAAYSEAIAFDKDVLVERYISGEEYTVAVLGTDALAPIRLETDHSVYDFDAKYCSDDTQYHCPCGLPEDRVVALKNLALDAFNAVGARGWGRVDVMAEADHFYLLEVNTVPGMTSHSLVPIAAKAEGLEFNDLVVQILHLALEDQ